MKVAGSRLNPSCHISHLEYGSSCVYNVYQRKDCSLLLICRIADLGVHPPKRLQKEGTQEPGHRRGLLLRF